MTPDQNSQASSLASLPAAQRQAILSQLSNDEARVLLYDWRGFWARPNQLAPAGDWSVWALIAGRGFGKTLSGAQWVREQVELHGKRRIALVGRTSADCRDTMIEGESGILNVCPPWNRPLFEGSKRRLTWPNGAIATYYSADKPEQLRGPQHDSGWADELSSWQYEDSWDQLNFGMRLGDDPRIVVTSTPRAIKLIRELLKSPTTAITRGSTFDNSGNLAKQFLDVLVAKYQNTRLGRQEINAELLEDVEGALWNHTLLDLCRVNAAPALKRIIISVDPSVSEDGSGDACGLIAAGLGEDGHGYLLEDGTLNGSPDTWANKAVSLFHKWKADRIVAESNQGGALVSKVLRTVDANVPVSLVHASRGKFCRAEPISALYEQHRCHHVGSFAETEDELSDWTPNSGARSPNRLDALVWAFTHLMLGPKPFNREILRPT